MERGGATETEGMPSLVVGYIEKVGGKLKSCKGFSKPNFERGLNRSDGKSSKNCEFAKCRCTIEEAKLLGGEGELGVPGQRSYYP